MKIINNCSYLSVTNVIWLERQKRQRAPPSHGAGGCYCSDGIRYLCHLGRQPLTDRPCVPRRTSVDVHTMLSPPRGRAVGLAQGYTKRAWTACVRHTRGVRGVATPGGRGTGKHPSRGPPQVSGAPGAPSRGVLGKPVSRSWAPSGTRRLIGFHPALIKFEISHFPRKTCLEFADGFLHKQIK